VAGERLLTIFTYWQGDRSDGVVALPGEPLELKALIVDGLPVGADA
jgi:hypothetical protein